MQFANDIKECIKVLQNGGLILYPTDTIWGIGCDATNAKAVEQIYLLKQRANAKSMVVLVDDEKKIAAYIPKPDLKIFDYIKGIHKPTTVIYEGAVGLAANVISTDGTAAIRIANDEFCQQLIREFNKPIVSTSANISGYPPPQFFADIDIQIKNGVDYIVHHRQDDTTPSNPSAIIKWNTDGTIAIIRS